jgi:microcystin-dependent protein
MSFRRAKNQATNKNVYTDNRVSKFLTPHIDRGDLHVERNLTVGGDLSANNFYASGNYYLDSYLLIPYGTIIQSAAVVIPDGWLNCNGASLLKDTYTNLFNAILYTYGGSGDNFNVPDIRGRVIVGTGTGSGLTNRTLGSTGGAETHTLTTNEMPSHSHGTNSVENSLGLMTANGTGTTTATDNSSGEPSVATLPKAITISNTGGDQAHNNMQPFIVFNYLIKY